MHLWKSEDITIPVWKPMHGWLVCWDTYKWMALFTQGGGPCILRAAGNIAGCMSTNETRNCVPMTTHDKILFSGDGFPNSGFSSRYYVLLHQFKQFVKLFHWHFKWYKNFLSCSLTEEYKAINIPPWISLPCRTGWMQCHHHLCLSCFKHQHNSQTCAVFSTSILPLNAGNGSIHTHWPDTTTLIYAKNPFD